MWTMFALVLARTLRGMDEINIFTMFENRHSHAYITALPNSVIVRKCRGSCRICLLIWSAKFCLKFRSP